MSSPASSCCRAEPDVVRRRPLDVDVQQEVLDSALRLLAYRRQALEVVDVAGSGSTIVASGGDLSQWTMRSAWSWTSLLSTTPVTSVTALARSVPNNRALIEHGLKMRSVFDVAGSESPAWVFLAAEPDADTTYFASFAPLFMRIVDHRYVLMPGPSDRPSILRMSAPAALEAALVYWNTLFAHAIPSSAVSGSRRPVHLPARQTLIIEQLTRGHTDAQIASSLSLSTRTIQSEIASLMARYGVTSRFALGFAYASGPPPGPGVGPDVPSSADGA